MTVAQTRALETLRERYCLPLSETANPIEHGPISEASGQPVPVGLEIGFGMGHALLHWARACPHWQLFGVEVYQPGIGSLMLGLQREALDNVRIFEAPAEDVLAGAFTAASLDEVRIFFPDPWPKKRHHKRRLVQPAFVGLLAERMRPGACLWLATDWEAYAQWMLEVLEAEPLLDNQTAPGAFAVPASGPESAAGPSGAGRLETRFEARGKRLGHQVWDLLYQRKR
jgi:tRNA (guanine-N7-)-methyltransferase